MSEPLLVVYGLYVIDIDGYPVRYVGLTTRGLHFRFKDHIKGARANRRLPVYDWIRKHGVDNIGVVILEICDSVDDLRKSEIFWIDTLSTFNEWGNSGLNCTVGGEGSPGRILSKEDREAISRRQIGTHRSEETRQRMREASRHLPHSDETRQKMREAWTPERRVRAALTMRKVQQDYPVTEERCVQLSIETTYRNHERWHTRRAIVKPECTYCDAPDTI